MGILMDHRTEAMTLWRITGQDMFNKATYSAPTPFNARYQDKEEVVVTTDGRQITSSTQIFTEDLALKIGDWVVLGTSVDAAPPVGARQIEMVSHKRFVTQNANVYKGIL